jgi:signal transduction histidine kinase
MTPRAAARLAWSSVTLTVLLTAAGAAIELTDPPWASGRYPQFPGVVEAFSVGVVGALVGALIASRHPRNAIGWIFCGSGLAVAFTAFGLHYSGRALLVVPGSLPAGHQMNWLVVVVQVGWAPLFTFLLLLFPDGRLPSRRWRPVAWATVLVLVALAVVLAIDKGPPAAAVPGVQATRSRLVALAVTGASAALLAVILLCTAALLLRLRRASGDERRQLRWFVSAATLLAVAAVVNAAGVFLYGNAQPWGQAAVALAGAAVPVAAGVAIFKYRLYDIDLIINRAIVLFALASFITAGYVAVVAGIGQVARGRWESTLWLPLVATAAVALAAQPVRRRLQHLADRLVYGPRATPYEVLAGFTDRIAGALRVEEVLPRMAEAAALGVEAARGRVTVLLSGGAQAVSWPPDAPAGGAADRTVRIVHQGEQVGELAVAMPPGRTLTRAEDRLLGDLAAQAGLALRNARLAIELQARVAQLADQAGELEASRQRLIQAQDQERQRLERAIRQRPHRQLASIVGKLQRTEEAVGRDAETATAVLDALDGDVDLAAETLRDLGRGLFPPLLADKGLLAALAAHVRRSAPEVAVEAGPGAAARLPPHVEAAAYFCCVEALDNAARHAAAAPVTVRLDAREGWLEFSVTDRGPGLGPAAAHGAGLQHMADRVEALAGTLEVSSAPALGTRVDGRIPLHGPASLSGEASTPAGGVLPSHGAGGFPAGDRGASRMGRFRAGT